MQRKKITWITPDCFVDCDLPIMPYILKVYDVHWIVLFGKKGCNRFNERDFEEINKCNSNLQTTFLYKQFRERSPKNISYYNRIVTFVKNDLSDMVYANIVPHSPWTLFLLKRLTKERLVAVAHDGSIKGIMRLKFLAKLMFRSYYGRCKYINMFSPSQARLMRENFSNANIVVIPLAPKNYGKPTEEKDYDSISFVSFGTQHEEKNTRLLIEAANQLYEEGIRNFKVFVHGAWCISNTPDELVRHKEIFDINPVGIPNTAIPNLFARSHFAVYPYKDMSQSGAVKVAFAYNIPVIVSDLDGFKDEVKENIDGYFFKSEDIDSLKGIMRKAISLSREEYDELANRMAQDMEERYSERAISNKYLEMFATVENK